MRNGVRWFLQHSFITPKTLLFTAALTGLLFWLPGHAASPEVILSSDPNRESDLAGSGRYYATTSGRHSVLVDVVNTTPYTLTNFKSGRTHYFSAADYDDCENESEFYEEISFYLTGKRIVVLPGGGQ